jgi:hypothetical protein
MAPAMLTGFREIPILLKAVGADLNEGSRD